MTPSVFINLSPYSARVRADHLLSCLAAKRLSEQPDILEVVCTNTAPIKPEQMAPKLTVLSIARPMAEAIQRIHDGQSVSALFQS